VLCPVRSTALLMHQIAHLSASMGLCSFIDPAGCVSQVCSSDKRAAIQIPDWCYRPPRNTILCALALIVSTLAVLPTSKCWATMNSQSRSWVADPATPTYCIFKVKLDNLLRASQHRLPISCISNVSTYCYIHFEASATHGST